MFIIYNGEGEEFAKQLHSRLREAKIRVWFASEDMNRDGFLNHQIERAIQMHDRLLLVLSRNGIRSNWVEREIRMALVTEKKLNRRKLFPLRLMDYEALENWRIVDARTAQDYAEAETVLKCFIPDFSN